MNKDTVEKGWIGVDLDGTLAYYESGMYPLIGPPIKPMLDRVLDWLNSGRPIKIMTARATQPEQIPLIEAWCLEHLGRLVPITCCKDFSMLELWDDRAIQVIPNTGIRVRTESDH